MNPKLNQTKSYEHFQVSLLQSYGTGLVKMSKESS